VFAFNLPQDVASRRPGGELARAPNSAACRARQESVSAAEDNSGLRLARVRSRNLAGRLYRPIRIISLGDTFTEHGLAIFQTRGYLLLIAGKKPRQRDFAYSQSHAISWQGLRNMRIEPPRISPPARFCSSRFSQFGEVGDRL